MTLGDKLSRLRKENNYTQEQLADVLGVSRQTISKWESDIAYPETDKLIRISKLFHCTTDYLLLEEKETVTDEKRNGFEHYAFPTNQIFIESPLTKNLVSCIKITASPVIAPTNEEAKYLLLGVDKVTVLGQHITKLGWYETEEDVQRELSEITSAIREGKNCYTLRYSVEIDQKALGAVIKKIKVQDKHAPYIWGKCLRERKSDKIVFGMPLWHIGKNARGIVAVGIKARGVVAIGLKAKGIVSLGAMSIGLLSFGMLSFGLISLGILALDILSVGCFSLGVFSLGAISLGIISLGAIAIGNFSVGAIAIGKYFALGDHVRAMIAIGDTEAVGSVFQKIGELTEQETTVVKELLDLTVPTYLSWANEIIKLFF